MDKQTKSVPLTEKQRSALQAICRQRKVDALVCKRARAFLLLDAGYDAKTICEILDISPTVLPEWRFASAGAGLSFFGLKDYSQRQGHLSVEQERATQAHFTEHSARNILRGTQIRFAPILWLSMTKVIAPLEPPSGCVV